MIMCDVFVISMHLENPPVEKLFSLNYHMSLANLQFQRPTNYILLNISINLGFFVYSFVFCSHVDVGKLHGGRIKLEE